MKKVWRWARRSAAFLLVLALFCVWVGAFAYLCHQAVKEPFFSAEFQSDRSLSWVLMGKEGHASLKRLDQAAETVQRYWVLLPAPWRLTVQTTAKIYTEKQKTG